MSIPWIARTLLCALGIAGTASLAAAAGSAPQPTICTRSCWGARSTSVSQMSSLSRAVIHHTATAADFNTTSQSQSATNVRAIQNYHMDTNGWSDIGYHFLVDKLGNRFEGRNSSMTARPSGAHDGVNTNSMGFNVMGYFHSPHNQSPPSVQRNALYDIIAWKMPNGWSAYGGGTYGGRSNVGYLCGHRDALATACPGDLMYTYIGTNLSAGEARNAVNQRINGIELVVDNTSGDFQASSNWFASTSNPGYLGTNYQARPTAAVVDEATWYFLVQQEGNYEVFVRWTSGSNRSTAAPYTTHYASGGSIATSTLYANQQANGGQWMSLGTFWFWQGYAKRVTLGCNATAGYYVIADAVKLVKR